MRSFRETFLDPKKPFHIPLPTENVLTSLVLQKKRIDLFPGPDKNQDSA